MTNDDRKRIAEIIGAYKTDAWAGLTPAQRLEAAEQVLQAFESAFSLCESPIETLMLAGLMYSRSEPPAVVAAFPFVVGMGDFYIWPQRQVGRYRIDLTVVGAYHAGHGGIRIAVECDGHDFHERTPEQAIRDKARDRYLTAHGWTPARFTGREIVADPMRAGGQVWQIAEAYVERQNALLGANSGCLQ